MKKLIFAMLPLVFTSKQLRGQILTGVAKHKDDSVIINAKVKLNKMLSEKMMKMSTDKD